MIEFHPPELADKPWIDRYLAQANYQGSEYNFTNLLCWNRAYGQEIAQMDGFLVIRVRGRFGNSYLYPAGRGEIASVLQALGEDAKEQGEPLRFLGLTAPQIEELEALFPGRFRFEADRNGSDYLYEIDRLADLGGKKLHAKRNHINRFVENNPDWRYEAITPQSILECLKMDEDWFRQSLQREGPSNARDLGNETYAIRTAMEHYQLLGLEGGLIRVRGQVVAFTIGDRLNADTFDVHFEKAYAGIQGAYAIINREFARHVRDRCPGICYMNREDDMGLEGLRKAKESYYPDKMVEKHTAVEQN